MIATLRFMWATWRHKWFVFLAGLRTGTPIWQLVVHDLSKFTPREALACGRHFYGDRSDKTAFKVAVNHHKNRNPHHWEYWAPVDDDPLPMPDRYIREMVADWMGASRAYQGAWPKEAASWPWLKDNFDKIKLHPETRKATVRIISEIIGR